VLDAPTMQLRRRMQRAQIWCQVAALGQAKDGLQRVRAPQPRVVAAVEELQGLHDELDLADAAATEMDVGRVAALGANGAVDLSLHRPDRRDDARVDPRTIDGFTREVREPGADRCVARGDSSVDQSLPLP